MTTEPNQPESLPESNGDSCSEPLIGPNGNDLFPVAIVWEIDTGTITSSFIVEAISQLEAEGKGMEIARAAIKDNPRILNIVSLFANESKLTDFKKSDRFVISV